MLSRKTDYALRTLLFLAKEDSGAWLPASKISRQLRVPLVFLAKICQSLAKHKVIETVRGKSGGIRILNKNFSLWDIIAIFEPRFSLNKCLRKDEHCFMSKYCPLHKYLRQLDSDLKTKLKQVSITELAKERG